MKLKPLHEQVIVVLGASSGIGRATALEAARRGARVVAAARGEPGLDSLLDEIEAEGGRAVAVVADTAEFEQVKAVAERAVAEYGRIDTWVHAAAVSVYASFEQTTPEEFERIVDVNLLGQAYGAMAALPHLKREGGALIHISSIEARRPMPLHVAYNATKHGLDGLIGSLRMELEHEGAPVSVTNIMPASIDTPFFAKTRTKLGVQPRGIAPIYRPQDVAEAVLYAAEHPTREIAVGGAGRLLLSGQRWLPRLTTAVLQRIAYRAQRSDRPKGARAPHNLFRPLPGYDRVEGELDGRPSLYTWLRLRPAARLALAGLVLGGVAGALLASGTLSQLSAGARRAARSRIGKKSALARLGSRARRAGRSGAGVASGVAAGLAALKKLG